MKTIINKTKNNEVFNHNRKRKNGLIELLLMRFATIGMNKVKLWTFILLTLLVAMLSVVALGFLDTTASDASGSMNIIILINTVLIIGLGVYLSSTILRGEISNNLVSLEQREGYSKRDMYLSRIIELISEFAIFMIFQIVVNMIVIGSANQIDEVLWYKMYVISLGWYAVMLIIGISLGIFFSSFSIASVSRTVVSVLMIILMLMGFICGVTNVGRDTKNPFDNSLQLLQDIRNSRVKNFSSSQLQFGDLSKLNKYEDIFMKWDYRKPNPNKDVPNNGLGPEIPYLVTDYFSDSFKPWIQTYADINDANPDNKESSTFGAMNAFGAKILNKKGLNEVEKISPKLLEFIKDTDNYFDNYFSLKFKYSDLMNWTNFVSLDSQVSNNSITDDNDGYMLKENLQKILREMQNSWYAKKYNIVGYLKHISDSSLLNILGVYPKFADTSRSSQMDFPRNVQKDIECTKVNPAEMIYNKYIFWAIAESISPTNDSFVANGGGSIHTYRVGNEAHKTAMGMIYNPLIQFSQMLNGVNYRNVLCNDTLNSYDTDFGSTRTALKRTMKGNLVSYQREAHVEPIYVGYVVFNSLLIFVSYWIYRKKIME